MDRPARCDLHVHSVHSTDTGSFALRRARLGESYTEPERVHDVCLRRGMRYVTISDHNTVEGALRIAHLPRTFLSEEVTTRFPEDGMPLHVLVWGLTEEDHSDLQPWRSSVYELVSFLQERGLAHALAHPLYRMGPPITAAHVERMMLLFGLWEGRNGARPEGSNDLACRLAAAVTPAYLEKLAERHHLEPRHAGHIGLTAGSDDHGGLDIATTWTEASGSTADEFLRAVTAGAGEPRGAHGSTAKLAHAVGALALNAYRRAGGVLPTPIREQVAILLDEDADDAQTRHAELNAATGAIARVLAERARSGALALESLPTLGSRLGSFLLAGALDAPYLAALRHHAGTRHDVEELERAFFAIETRRPEPYALVFTDTFDDANGVAGTMRRLAAEAAAGHIAATIVTTRGEASRAPGLVSFAADWSIPLPTYEALELRSPSIRDVLAEVETAQPDVIHVTTPGPVGLSGLAAAKLLGIPLVGSYHTELGPYALHLTKDVVVADALDLYVLWFYRQCASVLAPTRGVAAALAERGFGARARVWGRGVDTAQFSPDHRSEELRGRLLGERGEVLLLSVGRLSEEKRIHVLLEAFARLRDELRGLRLAVVGDGPARDELERDAPGGVRFLGELRGDELAAVYASADVFCFPSTTDTFGQVLIEAGASGLPVVAAAAGGALDLVAHRETGLLGQPDDPNAFADALRELALDAELRLRLAGAGRAAALERTWARSIDELRAAYAAAAGRDRPGRVVNRAVTAS